MCGITDMHDICPISVMTVVVYSIPIANRLVLACTDTQGELSKQEDQVQFGLWEILPKWRLGRSYAV